MLVHGLPPAWVAGTHLHTCLERGTDPAWIWVYFKELYRSIVVKLGKVIALH